MLKGIQLLASDHNGKATRGFVDGDEDNPVQIQQVMLDIIVEIDEKETFRAFGTQSDSQRMAAPRM